MDTNWLRLDRYDLNQSLKTPQIPNDPILLIGSGGLQYQEPFVNQQKLCSHYVIQQELFLYFQLY